MKKIKILFILIFLLFTTQYIHAVSNSLKDYIVDSLITKDGRIVVVVNVPGKPPDNYRAPIAYRTKTSVIIPQVPAFDWSFGCSATAAAMLAGHYDNVGYPNVYDGPTNGGLMPMDNLCWPDICINGEIRHQCPLSATRNGLDSRTIAGHVDDYWISYGSPGPDPWTIAGGGSGVQHTYGECTGDYMKTNQWLIPEDSINTDGGTSFYIYFNGDPMTYSDIVNNGYDDLDGSYGLKQFFESRGYIVTNGYTQLIYGYNGVMNGFTYDQFKNEIDSGKPVLIGVTGHTMIGYGYDDEGGTNTIYIHDTWDHNQHTMIWGGTYHEKDHIYVTTIELEPAVVNVWTGNYDYDWGNALNWSLGHIPDNSENVEIPDIDMPCIVDNSDKWCHDLTIYPGAIVQIYDQKLTVKNNAKIHGSLLLLESSAELGVEHDIVWESGSTGGMSSLSTISVYGDWYFNEGANVKFNAGSVVFKGTNKSWFISNEDNCHLYDLINDKTDESLHINPQSIDDLFIHGDFTNSPGSLIEISSSHAIYLSGFFLNLGGHFKAYDGTFIFDGNPSQYSLNPHSGDFFNNLIIDIDNNEIYLGAFYADTLKINGNFTLQSGYFNTLSFQIEIGGNWTNNAGVGNFIESTSKVRFNGSDYQYIFSDENFNVLEIDCEGMLRISSIEDTITCNEYDWVSGGIEVLAGTFNALDLADNSISGDFSLLPNGTINLFNSGPYVNLKGAHLYINGGNMNVNGGSFNSVWPYIYPSSIEMTDGILDFKDNGINLSNLESLTAVITGGTIRTRYGFTGNRTDFNPTGGTIELYGSSDANLSIGSGSNFHNVLVNKVTTEHNKFEEYNITHNERKRNNCITASSNLDINGDFVIDAGIFDTDNYTLYVAGNWENNIGDTGFIEDSSLVVFDGNNSADILTNETFYDMILNKTYIYTEALEIGSGDNNGVDVTILNNLDLIDGSMELNNPTNIIIGNILTIHDGAIFNANDTGSVNIYIQEDWLDFNENNGFYAGSSSVVTFNGIDSTSVHQIRENDYFNNIIIDSDAAYLRPSNFGPVIYCNNMDIISGKLRISSYKVIVDENITVSGSIEMIFQEDSLITKNITWESGSTSSVINGNIFVSGDWTFADDTDAQLGDGNTVYFNGSEDQFIYCMGDNNEFGNIIIDKPLMKTWIDSSSTDSMRISGNMTIIADNSFHIGKNDMIIQGILDVENTGALFLDEIGGTLTNCSDFTLSGELNIHGGDALINGMFNLATSGSLMIHSGSLISDDSSENKEWMNLRGTFYLNDGLFEIKQHGIYMTPSCTSIIAGGIIRTGVGFYAESAGIFEPTDGSVEFIEYSPGNIFCCNGNFFHDLKVDKNSETQTLDSDITIINNIEISSGSLDANGYNMYVGGNWINNVGTTGFTEGTGTVIFDGSNNSEIITNETFYNLIVNKITAKNDILEISEGNSVIVTNDLNVDEGVFRLNDNTQLSIGNSLNVNNCGILDITCSSGNQAMITHHTGFYDFDIQGGGTIRAKNGIFEYMNYNGVNVNNRAIIDTSFSFDNCLFRNGESDGTLLTINNDQILSIKNVEFPVNTWGGLHNVSKTLDQGHLEFINAKGGFSDEAFENDLFDRIDWFELPAIDDLTIVYNTGTGNIELSWTYPASADSFNVYRDTVPYFAPSQGNKIAVTIEPEYSEPASGTKYFYKVTAVKFCTSSPIVTKNRNLYNNKITGKIK